MVEAHGQVDVKIAEEIAHDRSFFAHVDHEHHHLALQVAHEALHHGQLVGALGTPGRHEVDPHGLAAKVGRVHEAAVGQGHADVGRNLTDRHASRTD